MGAPVQGTAIDQQQSLRKRLDALLKRLTAAERAAAVLAQLHSIHARLDAVEQQLGAAAGVAASNGHTADADVLLPAPADGTDRAAAQQQASLEVALAPGASPIQQRLARELADKGVSYLPGNLARLACNRFVRAPPEYYSRPLEFRRQCLQAASIDHLCKSIIMVNTRAHPSVKGWDDPDHSLYYLVIVQYTARLHAEKLKNFIHKLGGGKFGKQWYNMRLCPGDISDELSGYKHNAVTPIGIKSRIPIIMSDAILKLQPDFFWMGGGEVDLKVGMSPTEFVEMYKPMVVDCTYERVEGEEASAEIEE